MTVCPSRFCSCALSRFRGQLCVMQSGSHGLESLHTRPHTGTCTYSHCPGVNVVESARTPSADICEHAVANTSKSQTAKLNYCSSYTESVGPISTHVHVTTEEYVYTLPSIERESSDSDGLSLDTVHV